MTEVLQHKNEGLAGVIATEAAKQHFLHYLSSQKDSKGVRFSVKKTGCSGLAYVVDYVIDPQESDLKLPFDGAYFFYIDKGSYPYLKGMTVDFVKQGLNQKLMFSNPNQVGQCGCGESFTVE